LRLSEDLRDELAAIAPDSDCDRLAELSGLFHVAGSVHLRGRGVVDVHLDLVSSGVARRAFSLLRAFGVDSEIRTYQRQAFDHATRYQLHVEGTPDAYATLHRAGCSTRRTGRSSDHRSGSSHAAAAVAPTCGAHCSAPAR
jgi:Uncharacterized protein conserved in bacteria